MLGSFGLSFVAFVVRINVGVPAWNVISIVPKKAGGRFSISSSISLNMDKSSSQVWLSY
jgi:hypothetical protein